MPACNRSWAAWPCLRTASGSPRDADTGAAHAVVATDLGPADDRCPSGPTLGGWRRAVTRPACHPGARPPAGGRIASVGRPLWASSQAITELESHISPVPSSSRPQTGLGRLSTSARRRWATTGSSLNRWGLATASLASAITPSRQRRTSKRNTRQRPSRRLPPGPPRPRRATGRRRQGWAAVFDHKATLGNPYDEGGVVQVERSPVLPAGVDGLPDVAVQAHEPTAGAEGEPIQLDACLGGRWGEPSPEWAGRLRLERDLGTHLRLLVQGPSAPRWPPARSWWPRNAGRRCRQMSQRWRCTNGSRAHSLPRPQVWPA
jgi:hypothetical protein